MNHTSRRAAIQVGITGLVALALLLVGIAWIKDYRLGKKKRLLVARFEEVGNLSEGDPVSVRGVKKGAVTDVHLQDQGVTVTFELERDVALHPDAVIRIANIGFMGEKFLALDPGSDPGRFDLSKPIPGRYQSGVPEVISGARDLITQATELSSRLNEFLDAVDPATMQRASKNLERMSASLSTAVDRNQEDLRQAILDFKSAASQMKSIASNNSEAVGSSIRDFGTASRRLTDLSEKLGVTADALQRVVLRLDNKEGSLGKAIADSTLYDDLRETLRNTNDLVKDIKKNPKRYIKLGIF
ncbi:MAG: MCE family protein [Candidatus Eisenbacteria bacterium]|uniref:MCE family protein n=1 Tax=Eiseniibacteriota bacterium TaxID=2212470 RepID=A0A538SZM5_UNCEI|nr:MAG: MCE family protein [Candidatus Eisenbacteria bacterium]